MFGSRSTSGFGGFGASSGNTGTSPFGAATNNNTSPFGANNNATSGGGIFGAGNSNTSAFGSTNPTSAFGGGNTGSAFGATNNNNNTSGGLFGATNNTNASPFGASNTAGSAFGANTGSAFGLSNTGGGGLFGSSASKPAFGGGFGSTPTNNSIVPFGGNSAPGLGSNDPNANNGTPIPFNAYTEKDTTGATNYYQNIAPMPEYKNFSFEELRLKDYELGRRYPNGGATNNAFGATGTGSLGFGANNNTSAFGGGLGAFGASTTNNNNNNSPFGGAQNNNSPFGASSGTSAFGSGNNAGSAFGGSNAFGGAANNNAFGATKSGFGTSGSAFGSSNTTGGGLFGSSNNNNTLNQSPFGNNNQTNAFGANNNSSPFGANKTTTGFGGSNNSPFGALNNNNNASGGLFGANNNTNSTFGGANNTSGFGASNTLGGGLFGAPNNNNTSTFGQNKPAGGGLFGALNNTGGFGATNNNASGGLFGSSQANNNNAASGGLFGAKPAAATGGGLFGNTLNTATTGGMFGANNNQANNTSGGGLFGAKPAAPSGGGLFGASNQNNTTGGFGATQNNASGGLFGANKQQSGGLFGNSNNQSTASGGGLFGSSNNQANSTGGGLFGGNNSNTSGGGLFGAKPAASAGTGGGLFGNNNQNNTSLLGGNTGGSGLFGGSAPGQQQPQQSLVNINAQNPYGNNPLFQSITGTQPQQQNGIAPVAIRLESPNNSKKPVTLGSAHKVTRLFSASASPGLGKATIKTEEKPVVKDTTSSSSDADTVFTKNTDAAIISSSLFKNQTNFRKLVLEKSKVPTVLTTEEKRQPPKQVAFKVDTIIPEPTSESKAISLTTSDIKVTDDTSEVDADGYWTSPSISKLKAMSLADKRAVSNFKIGRKYYGHVEFLKPVDLSSFPNLEDVLGNIIVFSQKNLIMYPDEDSTPQPGEGLNLPARITLEGCFPVDRATKLDITDPKHETVKKHIENLKSLPDMKFVSYDPTTGNWTFEITKCD